MREESKSYAREAMDIVEHAAHKIGSRLPGSDGEIKFHQYMGDKLRDIGIEPKTEEFAVSPRSGIGGLSYAGWSGVFLSIGAIIALASGFNKLWYALAALGLITIFWLVMSCFFYKTWFDMFFPQEISRNTLGVLEPEDGKDSVSGLQRYRAVVDAGLSTEEQMSVLGEMMQESEYSKLQTGYSYGVTPEAYVSFRELLPKFDFDGNGTFKQEEVEAAIDSMGGGGNGIVLPGAGGGQSLTVTQQAALWQLANKSWKPAKNPYSTSVGQKVYDALNAETESGIVLPDGTSYTGGLVLPKG